MHKNADLDALSSAYYLSEVLGDSVIVSDGLDKFAKNAAQVLDIPVKDNVDGYYEKIITVDTASREQLGKFGDMRIDAVYDHHESNNIEARERYVNAGYPSCAEMVYDIHRIMPSRKAAMLLIAGIISDTVWFRHANARTMQIVGELMGEYGINMKDLINLVELPINFGEKISVLKGFQRLIYRSVGDKIAIATRVSANESTVAMALLTYADVVLVASSRKNMVRIIGRSRELNLLEIFAQISEDFSCSYGGHRKAAGMSCMGDAEAILKASLKLASERLKG
ncbi:exopolyphosphatase-like enzyme [Aciduliprofundum sp. MAR08-339]|uniref:DHH family phosphoesterase n=1 Tax=Aciduliprofundum sp. (strain MAR08-339) TaxID=673860 RepID=UPI0002A49CAF|nr:exopolyphosphatase-like enzyme [Aciduliprofundum sp. MAR08-339]